MSATPSNPANLRPSAGFSRSGGAKFVKAAVVAALAAFGFAGTPTSGPPLVGAARAFAADPPAGAAAPAFNGSGWRVECGNDGKVLDCQVGMRVTQREGGPPLLGLTLKMMGAPAKPLLLVHLPLGILVNEPAVLKVDDGDGVSIGVETCRADGCFGSVTVSDGFLVAMRKGKQLMVAFKTLDKQSATLNVPLSGFGIAIDRLK